MRQRDKVKVLNVVMSPEICKILHYIIYTLAEEKTQYLCISKKVRLMELTVDKFS